VATPIEVLVPDIGGFKDVSVIDVLVKDGQQIEKETPLVTIETEKAAMDVPAPVAGKITQVRLKTGDKVSEGSLILLLEPTASDKPAPQAAAPSPAAAPAPATQTAAPPSAPGAAAGPAAAETPSAAPPSAAAKPAAAPSAAVPATVPRPGVVDEKAFSRAHASPSVRKFARELGADLGKVKGTGVKGRITQDDVKAHVKTLLVAAAATPAASTAAVSALPKVPVVDFAYFGTVEVKPLSRIQKISGSRLQASWLNLPHVTQHEDADITELEETRNALKGKASQEGVRLTPLAFIIKACIATLQEFPRFNSSLDAAGANLVLKKYFNIGFAADTPNGLMVPVIPNADRLNIYEIARELGAMSEKARTGKLKASEMQGGSFTISSPSSMHPKSQSSAYRKPVRSRCISAARSYRG
jgi:pyruvate dehydrogenase E2 component (dihydrolipoamide acetyltransferase)